LPLPASLTWIEADLPAVIDEKERLLAGETPACTLVRARVDLADPAARAAFLSGFAGDARTLVITEGLLYYLAEGVVAALARDLGACAALRWWILDLMSPGSLAMIRGTRGHRAAHMMSFAPREGVAFFEPAGWRLREVQSIVRAGVRFGRAPWRVHPAVWFPDRDPRAPGRARWFAVARFERG
jgi:O-methyltransferase involved in polyketide biosynthesis